MLSNKQLGFIKGRTTILQLLKVMDIWIECLESCDLINVIYTNLEKAFDKVLHKRLISELYSYKINLNVIKWIKSLILNIRKKESVLMFLFHMATNT